MQDTMKPPAPADRTTRRAGPPLSSDLVAVAAAVVCVLVMWGCLAVWGGVDLTADQGGEVVEISGVAVALSAAVAGLLGVALLRVLERVTPHALRIWTVTVAVVTLVSTLGPLSATSAAATGTLLAMHAIVAVVLVVSLHRNRRWGRVDRA